MSKHIAIHCSLWAFAVLAACAKPPAPEVSETRQELLERVFDQIPNNLPIPDSAGLAASFHPAGFVNLSNNYFTPQGTNGRQCGTCHAPENGWSITPATVTLMFLLSGGTDPLFVNNLDTDTPTSDMSSVVASGRGTSPRM